MVTDSITLSISGPSTPATATASSTAGNARHTITMTAAAASARRSWLKASQKIRHSEGRRNMRRSAAESRGAGASATSFIGNFTTLMSRPSGSPDPRVQGGDDDVGAEVDEDEHEGRDQHRRLHDRQVASDDGAVDLQADPRPGEDHFREERPAHQVADLKAHK